MTLKKSLLAIALLAIALFAFRPNYPAVVIDYLTAGKLMIFDKENYELQWSSHPSPNYYKQEYIRASEDTSNYHKILLLEALEGNMELDDAIKSKTDELDERKKWDYVANYQVFENKNIKNEAMIDFIVSDTGYIYEWNLYRYQVQHNNNKRYLVLFAYSFKDSLNDDTALKKFFANVKDNRMAMMNNLTKFSIPKISIKN